MDGWAVLRALKRSPRLQRIPVLMVTLVEEREMAQALGAAGYLSKPVDQARLCDIVQRSVRRQKKTSEEGDESGQSQSTEEEHGHTGG